MKCPRCGTESRIRANDEFCHKCGHPLKIVAKDGESTDLKSFFLDVDSGIMLINGKEGMEIFSKKTMTFGKIKFVNGVMNHEIIRVDTIPVIIPVNMSFVNLDVFFTTAIPFIIC